MTHSTDLTSNTMHLSIYYKLLFFCGLFLILRVVYTQSTFCNM